ncbi:hypothetical protein IL54_4410 [Sphingobium sp. ba1]|nr:hypothetical protein IL54_4410 [Sphingobium sp. ba1]
MRTGHHGGADRGRLFRTRIIIRYDHMIGQFRRNLPHQWPLACIAIPARAEQRDQPPLRMRPQGLDRGFQAIGCMGIIDIDRRARLADDRPFQPPAHGLHPAQQFQHLGHVAPGRDDQARCGQRIGGLIRADQRQIDGVALALDLDLQQLPQLRRRARDKAQRLPLLADRQQLQPARRDPRDHLVRPGIIGPHHRRAIGRDHFIEQPHLGVEIAVHIAMIVEMVARQIGEGARDDRQSFSPILVQPMARRLERGMADALSAQTRHVGEESDDVRRGKARGNLVDRRRHAQRADGGGMMPHHPPQLPRQFHSGCLAVGAGHRNGHIGERRKITRGQLREQATRIGVRNMDRALDHRFRPGDDGNRACLHRISNIILAIDAQPLERAEHRAARNLAIVDRKASDVLIKVSVRPDMGVQTVDQGTQPCHSLSPLAFHSSGIRSEISTSRRSSGITPSIGPTRSTTRLTTGDAVQAAVRRPNVSALPLGSSIIARTT